MDVFVKEPQLDWVASAKSGQRPSASGAKSSGAGAAGGAAPSGGSVAAAAAAGASGSLGAGSAANSSSLESDLSWYPKEKIRVAKRKLRGDNPCAIMVAELSATALPLRSPRIAAAATKWVMGHPSRHIRAKNHWHGCVTSAEQVECLVDLATDANILGRTWGGWMPFV